MHLSIIFYDDSRGEIFNSKHQFNLLAKSVPTSGLQFSFPQFLHENIILSLVSSMRISLPLPRLPNEALLRGHHVFYAFQEARASGLWLHSPQLYLNTDLNDFPRNT